jgi:hypothetical protein
MAIVPTFGPRAATATKDRPLGKPWVEIFMTERMPDPIGDLEQEARAAFVELAHDRVRSGEELAERVVDVLSGFPAAIPSYASPWARGVRFLGGTVVWKVLCIIQHGAFGLFS